MCVTDGSVGSADGANAGEVISFLAESTDSTDVDVSAGASAAMHSFGGDRGDGLRATIMILGHILRSDIQTAMWSVVPLCPRFVDRETKQLVNAIIHDVDSQLHRDD